ncbi:MAG: sensor histidine kinase, partial [Pseudomonadota bacterium]
MILRWLNSTQSTQTMTGRLALFFSLVSVVIGLFCFLLITGALLWSEDRVGERRIMIDKKEAIVYFQSHPDQGKIKLDLLTTAYNDINLVPEEFRKYLIGKKRFLDEIGDEPDS